MCADEADINHPVGIIDPHHDSILVPGDIEHRTPVSEDAGRANFPLQLRWARPIGGLDLPEPGHQGLSCIGITGAAPDKGLESAQRYDPHMLSLA